MALAAAPLVYIVLFWRLGATSMWDPDEAHYAQTTVEMIQSGDWLTPTFNGEPFFDKPVLFHWLQGLAMLTMGTTAAAARSISALASLALIGITGWFGAKVGGRTVGFLSALILTCNP